jgi:hypothetical protein
MRIVSRTEQKLEWTSVTWLEAVVLGAMAMVPLVFGIVGLVEGAGAAAVPIIVSILAMVLFAFFVGKHRVVFDRAGREVSVEFRSLLRRKAETRDLDQLDQVLVYGELGESGPELVDPHVNPTSNRVRYRAALSFRDGSEMSLSGQAKIGSEAHRIAQAVLDWLGP